MLTMCKGTGFRFIDLMEQIREWNNLKKKVTVFGPIFKLRKKANYSPSLFFSNFITTILVLLKYFPCR